MDPTSMDAGRMDAHTNGTAIMCLQTKEPATLNHVTMDHATIDPETMDPVTMNPTTMDSATIETVTMFPAAK